MSEFLDDNLAPIGDMPVEPTAGMPSGMSNGIKELTPEMLDAIINDESQHPELRRGAKQTKERLFPQLCQPRKVVKPKAIQTVEEVVEPPKPKTPKKKAPNKKKPRVKIVQDEPVEETPTLEAKPTSNEIFDSLVSSIQKDLYQEEIALLSDPSITVRLKSMSLEEYKFLTKQLEIFERDIENIIDAREIELREISLTNTLDTILQRCITNEVNVLDITVYDWIYLLLALRCISRPSESYFSVKQGKEKKRVKIDVIEILNRLRTRREEFCESPLGTVDISDDTYALIMPPTRGDMHFISKAIQGDPNASSAFLLLSCIVKAFVKDGKAYLMTPEQRDTLVSTCIDYDSVKEVGRIHKTNEQKFYNIINEYFQEEFGEVEAIEVSDFILFCYDF